MELKHKKRWANKSSERSRAMESVWQTETPNAKTVSPLSEQKTGQHGEAKDADDRRATNTHLGNGSSFVDGDKYLVQQRLEIITGYSIHHKALQWRNCVHTTVKQRIFEQQRILTTEIDWLTKV